MVPVSGPLDAVERIRQELAEGNWAWRSVDALATKAALTHEETLGLLEKDPVIELDRAKSGRFIARSPPAVTADILARNLRYFALRTSP